VLSAIVVAFAARGILIAACQAQEAGQLPRAAAFCDSVGSIGASLSPPLLPSHAHQPLTASAECALKPKDTFKECEDCPEMIVVPAGSFMMGSPATETGRSQNEGPLHRVNFAHPFAVGRFAVTFDEWDACVAGGACNAYKPADHKWGRGRKPAIYVSWYDAKAYLDWLSRKTGRLYRLLSEAEWEYVARGGTRTDFWFGSSISPEQANYDAGNSQPGTTKSKSETAPVDAFAVNPWGLYQVHGNVSQWTEDCYNESYEGAPNDGSAWTEGDCSMHVLRGGSLIDTPKYLRAASRNADPAEMRTFDDGFRVARTLQVR
jgi:formylglycine-generating enzyme required for sulfatase activity